MTEHTVEKDAPREHVHDVSCAFGNPTCPAFGELLCAPKTGWLSGYTFCRTHGRPAGWPCSVIPGKDGGA